MLYGAIYSANYRPQFAGHETFPLRYGWLKKAYDGIFASDYSKDNRSVFTNEDAIARFGVGKNMVMSMRHWATSVGVLEDDHKTGIIKPSILGKTLFGDETRTGLDPYLENPASLWLIHWQLCNTPKKTTWHYVFNHYPGDHFDRSQLIDGLEKLAKDRDWGKISSATIRRDVECLVRTYVAKPFTAKSSPEDSLECPLAELGLIKPIGKRDGFRLVRGSKPTLSQGVFLYALVTFWRKSRYQNVNQLPFDFISHAPGSPGRVFLLDDNELATRLIDIDTYTNGVLSWSETSGIKAIIKKPSRCLRDNGDELPYIFQDFQ